MRFSRSDAAVSAAVLLGAAGLLYLFVLDLGAVSSRSGEKALGTIVFKKLSATRKAPSGLGWELMRDNSPVYNGDTLRTADFSEASVFFDDGTSLDLLEDSMLKLDLGGPVKNLEFISGSIDVGSATSATSYTISSTAGRIRVEKGSKATVSRDADHLSVEVSSGSAKLEKSDGSTQDIAQYQELQVDVKSGQSSLVERPIVPMSPELNGRYLAFGATAGAAAVATSGTAPGATIDFAWMRAAGAKAKPGASSAEYSLELSPTKDFVSPQVVKTSSLTARAKLGGGTWYWRVRDDAGNESPVRKFSLDIAEAPRPAYPPKDTRLSYRRIKPTIPFAWTGMDQASSYVFELSSDPLFKAPEIKTRTTTASLSVDSIGEGKWYWRATPVYAFTVVGAVPQVASSSLAIAKSPDMKPPKLTAPLDLSLYQVQDMDGTGVSFSWEPEAEAVSYELEVSSSRDLSSPIVSVPVQTSYLRLWGEAAAALKKVGSYYWGLRWKDKEGNLSPASEGRSLQGIDGSIAMHLSFPPDGYRIADSLVGNTRFAWKTNIPAKTVFQLARESEFKDIVYQETMRADTLIGHSWSRGHYYWRLRTYNADGTVFLDTDPRGFDVVDPFVAPTLTSPEPGSNFYLREHDPKTVTWAPVGGADYYTVTLRSAADNYGAPLFQRSFIEEPKLELGLGDLPSGSYRLSLQALAASGPATTRIIGYIGDSNFSFKIVTSIKLVSPANGELLPGLDARQGKSIFVYSSGDSPDQAEILVSTDPAGQAIVARAQDRTGRAAVGRLNPGFYYWMVTGSLAGFDVTSKDRYRFEVDPPPPLPAPQLSSPEASTVFDVAYFRKNRSIALAWQPVAGATCYRLSVSVPARKEPVLVKEKLAATSYTIDDLSVLDRGVIDWTVEARSYDDDGEIVQPGLETKSSFKIDIPVVRKAATSTEGKIFGH
jgi:hypothetical protein